MAGYNRIIIMGNLTRDPEYKQLTSGQGVCRLGLAANRQYKNRQTGDMVQEVCYVDIDVWGAQAESCRQYLQKGRAVLIEGRLKFDSWQDPEGKNRSKHSVVADRVMFLSAGNSAEIATTGIRDDASFGEGASDKQGGNSMQGARLDPNNPAEKELLDQIDGIKKRTAKKQADKVTTASADQDAEFNDEPPFQDDLPF
jgi:single-strand DNA-binding protein